MFDGFSGLTSRCTSERGRVWDANVSAGVGTGRTRECGGGVTLRRVERALKITAR